MLTGIVAAEGGVNIQTLRYYERRGLLPTPKRSPSGYRLYSRETVQIVRFIRRAKGLGFTLREIGELLRLRAAPARGRVRAVALATEKVADIDGRIRSLRSIRRTLATLANSCTSNPSALQCPILGALNGDDGQRS